VEVKHKINPDHVKPPKNFEEAMNRENWDGWMYAKQKKKKKKKKKKKISRWTQGCSEGRPSEAEGRSG
jgi:hypothetical protein